MAIRDPFVAYIAASNLEAHAICNLLLAADIEAMAIEDVSQVGTWIGGLALQLHKPQVCIERSDIDRAKPVLIAHEQRSAQRQSTVVTGASIEVTCEDCGKKSSFPEAQRGSVENRPHCESFVDVGDDAGLAGWNGMPNEEQDDT